MGVAACTSIQGHLSRLAGRGPTATGEPVDGCWFCLGSSSVDISLVASVGNEAYVALDKVRELGVLL